ncbi:7TM diverse intracellular signaling domain-containing protein [Ekhidna sp.]|uniref:sensor histidine kinase n=1 Tax=Ekhidna sp. TaxID=2608089 RepID=UPI003B50907E
MHQPIEMMEIGGIAIFAAYNLVLFFQIGNRHYLYLGLLCLVILVRATLVDDGSMVFYHFFPSASLTLGRKIEFFCSYAGVPLTLLFIHKLYTIEAFKKWVNVFLVISGFFLLFVLVTPYRIFFHTLNTYNVIILLSYILAFAMLFRAVQRDLTGSMYVFSGTALCFLFVMAELLKTSGVISVDVGPNLVNTGFVIFLFFQTLALSEIFAKSFRENQELNKDLEKRVDEKTIELMRASKLRDTLIRIVSHDIRGPLGNLKSVISLTRDGDLTIEQTKEFLATIDTGVDHTIQMLDELMEWGRAASSNQKISQDKIIIKEVLDQIIAQAKPAIDRKTLSLSIEGDLGAKCVFDKNALKVVLRNLMSNAIKFTEKGGSISVNLMQKNGEAIVRYSDTGIGIPDEMKASLFEMKKDNKRPGTENEKSSGVGLFICKDLVTQNGGIIQVFDNPDKKGSVFEVTMRAE